MRDNELPADYEPCGTCGFDHAYDAAVMPKIIRAHVQAGEVPDDFDPLENDCAG